MPVSKLNDYQVGIDTITNVGNAFTNIDYNRLGYDGVSVTWTGSAFQVEVGSLIEANGSLYAVTGSAISLGNSTGSVCFNSATETFSIDATAKSYSADKQGWYLDSSATTRVSKISVELGGVVYYDSKRDESGDNNYIRILTYTSGSGTYTPSAWAKWIKVICTGGGAGGTNGQDNTTYGVGGNGGYSGCTAIKVYNNPASGYSYSVGSGGLTGAAGGNTTFGSILAGGGPVLGGAAPAVSGGDINLSSGQGSSGQTADTTIRFANGGSGGISYWGGSSGGSSNPVGYGTYGTGGQGGSVDLSGSEIPGQSGIGGVIYIEEHS